VRASTRTFAGLVATALFVLPLASCSSGEDSAGQATDGETPTSDFALICPAFGDGQTIPFAYCLDTVEGGENVSLPLLWENAPDDTVSLALTMIDTSPSADDWVHWIVVAIPPSANSLPQGASGSSMPDGAQELKSSFGDPGYGGPAPPRGSGEHKYVVTVYALDVPTIDLPAQPSAAEIAAGLEGHVLASASVTGIFGR
jgi:Raf kinase inhibitor-like YbhB/YbcL family protein